MTCEDAAWVYNQGRWSEKFQTDAVYRAEAGSSALSPQPSTRSPFPLAQSLLPQTGTSGVTEADAW